MLLKEYKIAYLEKRFFTHFKKEFKLDLLVLSKLNSKMTNYTSTTKATASPYILDDCNDKKFSKLPSNLKNSSKSLFKGEFL